MANDSLVTVATGWIVFGPLWLITVATLGWGQMALSASAFLKALRRTGLLSLCAAPMVAALFANQAYYDTGPTVTSMWTGVRCAIATFPLYSLLLACPAFVQAQKAASAEGAPSQPPSPSALANLVLAIVLIFSIVVFVVIVAGTGRTDRG